MSIDIIEKNCLGILSELKNGKFTLEEMKFLERLFQEIVNKTKKILDSRGEKK